MVRPVPRDAIPHSIELKGSSGIRQADATDAELLLAIGEGSEPAFEELHRRYRSAVERSCRALVGTELEDCAQEVFVRIWRKAELFDRGRGSAPAWLMTLARRTALNFRKARRLPVADELPEDAGAVDPPDVDCVWLDGALARLPGRERAVLELAYFDGLSQTQIAAALEAPLGSVKSWTRRGLNNLATLLGEESQ